MCSNIGGARTTTQTSTSVVTTNESRSYAINTPVTTRQTVTDFMASHSATTFGVESLNNIEIGGVEYSPINYQKSGGKVYNEFQSTVPNSRGEFPVFQTVVSERRRKNASGGYAKYYTWDKSTFGTRFS